MMKHLGKAVAVAALVAAASAGHAQTAVTTKLVQLGIGAGASVPTGDLGNSVSTGYHGVGILALNPVGLPVGFRGEAAYHQFGSKAPSSGSGKIASLTANIVYALQGGAMATPYLIGGGGWYHESSIITGGVAGSNFGFNAGAGIKIPLTGFSTFIEARYTRISDSKSTSFIPITVGVLF